MNFLEARRILGEFTGGPELPFLFALSGTPDPFRLYLEAAGARRGQNAQPRFLSFNTLQQHLASPIAPGPEVYLLLPWDLVPEADWRSGVPVQRTELADAVRRAEQVAEALRRRHEARFLYLAAPIPPITGHPSGQAALTLALESIAAGLGAISVPPEAFSLAATFSSGCSVGGTWLGRVAELAVDALTNPATASAKVLVTDLDNTLWSGVIAEDGIDGIAYELEGAGYRHHIYQTLLVRLRREGALLAAVSRNDREIVVPPFRSGRMPLAEVDFVAVCASYHAKSAQIAQLAHQLNLGLDSFVFVDDNPVEREEVRQALLGVTILAFPDRDDELPEFLHRLLTMFGRLELTGEDRERTELYRRRLEDMVPVDANGADLTSFLASLEMSLVMHDRTQGDRTRAVQLINKTNQFNANGRRWTPEEVGEVLARGGKLITASLADRSGTHGEIICCLVGPDGTIEAFVMSCRIFQRRVECAFLAALVSHGTLPSSVRSATTDRNEPFRQFTRDPAFSVGDDGLRSFDGAAFARAHRDALELFDLSWE